MKLFIPGLNSTAIIIPLDPPIVYGVPLAGDNFELKEI